MNLSLLEEIGLTKGEIAVYMALLETGSSSVGPVIDKAKVSSSKIYSILDRLIDKGLVSYVIRENRKYFEAAQPSRILDYLQEKREKIKLQEKEVGDILPELELKRTLSQYSSDATLFRGMKGLETSLKDIFTECKKGDTVTVYTVGEVDEKIDRFFYDQYVKRAKKGIKTQTLFTTKGAHVHESRKKLPLYKGKVLPMESTSPAVFTVYGNKVHIRMGSSKEVVVAVIDNKNLADACRQQFDELWNRKVYTYEGHEQTELAYTDLLSTVGTKDETIVFAAKPNTKRSVAFNTEWNKAMSEKSKGVRLLYYGDTQENRERSKEIEKTGNTAKILQTAQTLPISTVVTQDTVLNTIWSKDPTTFQIVNKILADSYRENFELLWNQDTSVEKGFDAFERAWNTLFDELKPGESYNVFGASFGVEKSKKKYAAVFERLHKKRLKRGIKSKILFQPDTDKNIQTFGLEELYTIDLEYKTLPFKRDLPLEIYPQGDTTLLLLQEEEPTIITIKNKKITKGFVNFFDMLWNQDVVVDRGREAWKKAYTARLDELEAGEDYTVLGAAIGSLDSRPQFVDFFKKYHAKRRKKGVKVRLLFYEEFKKVIENEMDSTYADADLKFLNYNMAAPMTISTFRNKTVLAIQDKDPVTITIDNPRITASFKEHFEQFWNQDTSVSKGFDAVTKDLNNFMDEMKTGEDYVVIGAAYGSGKHKDRFMDFFEDFHKKRIEKKVNARLLFYQDHLDRIKEFPKETYSKYLEYKPLSYESELPVHIFTSKNRSVILTHGDDPTCVTINNDKISEGFRKHFDTLWNQETIVLKGVDAVQKAFEEMLEHGHCDFIGARGYFVDARREWIEKEWVPQAKKTGFTMRNLVDAESKGHFITQLDFATTKYHLPKEFASLSVFWIYGEKVVISNWDGKEPTVVMINNKALHNVYKQQFELMWHKEKF